MELNVDLIAMDTALAKLDTTVDSMPTKTEKHNLARVRLAQLIKAFTEFASAGEVSDDGATMRIDIDFVVFDDYGATFVRAVKDDVDIPVSVKADVAVAVMALANVLRQAKQSPTTTEAGV